MQPVQPAIDGSARAAGTAGPQVRRRSQQSVGAAVHAPVSAAWRTGRLAAACTAPVDCPSQCTCGPAGAERFVCCAASPLTWPTTLLSTQTCCCLC